MMPATQFTKLFTVYSAVLGYSTPLIYALTERREDTYRYVYLHLHRKEMSLTPSLCTTDFKTVNMNVI